MTKIKGVIFPILPNFINRLLVENRNVFVKYLPRNKTRISPNDKILFYVSHSSKEIVGEGQIEEILFLTPKEVLTQYGSKVFLSPDELSSYMLQQPRRDASKKLLVLVLSKIKQYPKPVIYKKPISMAGQYISASEYAEFFE